MSLIFEFQLPLCFLTAVIFLDVYLDIVEKSQLYDLLISVFVYLEFFDRI